MHAIVQVADSTLEVDSCRGRAEASLVRATAMEADLAVAESERIELQVGRKNKFYKKVNR